MSEPFDFDAFIAGTSLARRTVSAYRVDHRDAIDRLKAEYDAAPDDSGDEREGTVAKRDEIAQRIAALRAEMDDSRVEWVLRTLGPEEFRVIREDDTLTVFDQVAMQSNAPDGCKNPSLYNDLPHLTAEQWQQIAGVIGAAQWGELVTDANNLILSKVAVPDFSPATSRTRTPLGLSEN
jgi:hypothetical protein